MKRYETQAAKQDAIDTLRLIMSGCRSDEAFRGYARHLDEVMATPVAPHICCFASCNKPAEKRRSYCQDHSSVSWIGEERRTKRA